MVAGGIALRHPAILRIMSAYLLLRYHILRIVHHVIIIFFASLRIIVCITVAASSLRSFLFDERRREREREREDKRH
jgi:hypothetical protein